MKKKIRNLLLISIIFFIIMYFFYYMMFFRNNMIFGSSSTDWIYQHIQFPEYFRQLFYNEKNIIPQFSFNLGSGQNIFNIAYYGILNPWIILSYFFPNVPMYSYMGWLGFFIVVTTGILIYVWLQRNKKSKLNSFISSIYVIFAFSFIIQANANYMYLSYMPFLIITFIGIDLYFEKNIKVLFVIGSASCVLTSYVFIPSYTIAIILYCIYKYLDTYKKIKFKSFSICGFKLAGMYILGILLTSIMLMPTIVATFLGRVPGGLKDNFISLLRPRFELNIIIYNGIGLTSIALFVILVNLFNNKHKKIKMLAWFMFVCMSFPIFRVFLNGFLYDDTKVLFPYLLFVALIFCYTMDNIKEYTKSNIGISLFATSAIIISFSTTMNKLVIADIIFLCVIIYGIYKVNNKFFRYAPLILVVLISINTGKMAKRYGSPKGSIQKLLGNETVDPLINDVLNKDNNFYRINNCFNSKYTVNKVQNINSFNTKFYSSLINKNYKNFYDNIMNAPHNSLANTILEIENNSMFYTYMGTKYITLPDYMNVPIGYEKISGENQVSLYKNPNVFSLGYVTYKTGNYNSFNKLDYPQKQQALLNYIITNESNNSHIETNIKSIDILKDMNSDSKNINIENIDNDLNITVSNRDKIEYKLNNAIKNKILFINFDVIGNIPEKAMLGITINGIKNSLSSPKYRYYNKNRTFQYVLSSNEDINKLSIEFEKGNYRIHNLRVNTLDYDIVKKASNDIDRFNVDRQSVTSKGLKGNIDVKKDGWFVFTIPYDEGFTIKVDEKTVDYENVNGGLIGFKIDKGKHNIKLKYSAPGFKIGQKISIIALVVFVLIFIFDLRTFRRRRQ